MIAKLLLSRGCSIQDLISHLVIMIVNDMGLFVHFCFTRRRRLQVLFRRRSHGILRFYITALHLVLLGPHGLAGLPSRIWVDLGGVVWVRS